MDSQLNAKGAYKQTISKNKGSVELEYSFAHEPHTNALHLLRATAKRTGHSQQEGDW